MKLGSVRLLAALLASCPALATAAPEAAEPPSAPAAPAAPESAPATPSAEPAASPEAQPAASPEAPPAAPAGDAATSPAPVEPTPAPKAAAPPATVPAAAAAPVTKPESAADTSGADEGAVAEGNRDPLDGQILDATGYLLPGRTAELGLFYMGYGITDWLNVGVHPLAWIMGPILGGMLGNVSVKLGTPITRWVNVGLEGNLTWLHLDHEGGKVRGFVLPVTLGVSLNASESQNYSLAGRYVEVQGTDESDIQSQEVEGAAIVRAFQTIADARWRVSDSISIYARGYFQPVTEDLRVDSEVEVDDQTTVSIEGEASSVEENYPWAVLGGVHFNWGSVNLRLGVGYGNYFVPRISLPVYKGVFPDLDFYVRF